MTKEITKAEWKQFFDDLSREKLEWKTKIEVMDQETGAQILDEGLPLGGFTYEEATGEDRIEMMVGNAIRRHCEGKQIIDGRRHFEGALIAMPHDAADPFRIDHPGPHDPGDLLIQAAGARCFGP